ncbi:hypothetical protein C0Q70_09651 [Pomacea canaliculata]|uniref:CARD domain-containing protein n=1 Tax=Pomacea canaliculata TaxID=400727 RepID=A0A2T7PAD3_POMCA|nr:hypothetical protein C0Q70_09651 [Pomacea canaliculata]
MVSAVYKSKIGSRFKRRRKVQEEEEGGKVKVEMDESLCRGMVDVLLQTNIMAAKVEMGQQDMDAIVAMERSQDQEKETILLKVLGILLRIKAKKQVVSESFCENFIKKTEEDLHDLRHMIDREKEEEEEVLKNNPKFSKDLQALETALQMLQTKYNNKQGKLLRDYREKIHTDLQRSSGMSEEEVEDIMNKLMAQMGNLEEKIGQEQARQRRALEERLAKRCKVIDYQKVLQTEKEEVRNHRIVSMKDLLEKKVRSGQLQESRVAQIMQQYVSTLQQVQQEKAQDLQTRLLDTSEKLHQNRTDEMKSLMEKQAQERAQFLHKADAATSTAELVDGYHTLLSRQHKMQEELNMQLDQEDVHQMEKVTKEVQTSEDMTSTQEDEKVLEKLIASSDITETESAKLLAQHKQRMKEQQGVSPASSKQAAVAKLQEQLKQRLAQVSAAEVQDAVEQNQLYEEQKQTLQRVLASNMDLTDEAKEKILKQHHQNMQALSNQLQRSKMRHQKSLEIKLNQRRAHLADLKQQQDDLKRQKKEMNQKAKEKLEAELAAQIAAEEAKFEEARQAAVSELRRQLAAETEEALRVQDQEIGLLIGRLQVGQARRAAILERQDKTLKELQEQLEKKVAGSADLQNNRTDQLLQQHYNQMQHLNEQIQHYRETQKKQLNEKIEMKQRLKEKELVSQLEEDARIEFTAQQQRGAGHASFVLVRSFLEQKQQQAIANLEREMMAELQKDKEELNKQLEMELQKELQAQKQDLLNHLAAVSNLSKAELEDAVDAAVAGKHDTKTAKNLAKDLQLGIQRAKTSLSMDYGHEDLKRTKTNLERSVNSKTAAQRPGSARHLRQKEAFSQNMSEDEDDESYG